MFDLTSRSTLNNAINWYRRGRKWNKTTIPVLIGTKFDDFVQLPLEMQWTVVNEARASAKACEVGLDRRMSRNENMQLKEKKSKQGESLNWTDYLSFEFTQDVITEG
ncbi:hypothetical protein J5N97_030154 [Dioscorea zingiberensis]|uniref:Uncharacterized protein n=1 Tax=Dioscorea zingiberensis TaxID=325984 RepID=A0A9D5H400_9LILI|nr:hypothetical protein J5N97_030154 [Dioscorea zingiberensis]